MHLRFHPRLVAIALVGLAVFGVDAGGAASKERKHPRPPAPSVPEPVVDAWTAHAQRVATAKPVKPRRPDRLPLLLQPRLGQESGTAVCVNQISTPAPSQCVSFNGYPNTLGGAPDWLEVCHYSLISDSYPCRDAQTRASFPTQTEWDPGDCDRVADGGDPDRCEPALNFARDAAIVVSTVQPVRYTFWGREQFGPGKNFFPVTDSFPIQQLVSAVDVMTPRELYAAGAACPYCPLGNILVSASDQPTYNPLGAPDVFYHRVHDLTHADLTGATLTGIFRDWDLSGANLTGANLTRVEFMKGTQLADANFSGAILDDALFDGVDLSGANLQGARWDPARPPRFLHVQIGRSPSSGACTQFAGLDLFEVLSLEFSIDAVAAGCESVPMFQGARLRLAGVAPHLAQLDLTATYVYVDAPSRSALAGANLTGARLDGLTLVGFPADLTGTVFDGASMIDASFDLADFAGARLHGVDARGASFRGARFSAHGDHPAASFAGGTTNLTSADFVEADVSGVSFAGATLTGAVFSRALAVGTSFTGVSAENANFAGAHIYGDGQAFNRATTLQNADFTGAVLAAEVARSGGFDFTQAELPEAKFDRAQCIGCNFTQAKLQGASFTNAYLPGVNFAGAHLDQATLFAAWLYCGEDNSRCQAGPGPVAQWLWPLELGLDEAYGPVPFPQPALAQADLTVVAVCPSGKDGAVSPVGCDGHLLPEQSAAPAIPSPCSAAGLGSCPEPVRTLSGDGTGPRPLALAPLAPAYWATTGALDQGLLVAFDDGTVRKVTGAGQSARVAGLPGQHCPGPTLPCGDGGMATAALLGQPTGVAVDATGAVYIADTTTRRIRRVGADGTIQTVAGSGEACGATDACGDGGPATAAALSAARDVWADPVDNLWIADGARGIRLVTLDGLIHTVNLPSGGNVVAVTGDVLGTLYAATQAPDYLLQITHDGTVSVVVGTGTSGFNGNTDDLGSLLPGPQVQIDRPGGLATALNGTVFFADTGNNRLRGYVPGSGHVIEVGGCIVSGTPDGCFTGDQHAAQQTTFSAPSDIATTGTGQLAVADTGNGRVRQFAR